MGDPRLSEAELYIMQHFWSAGPMTSTQLAGLVADKSWKSTTLLTFLSRLAAKGMLAVEKQGKSNLYRPLIGETAYRSGEGRAFLEEMFGGSAQSFIAAMVEGNSMSREELASLRRWLLEQEVAEDG